MRHSKWYMRILAQALVLVMCTAVLALALHTGHNCSSGMDCLICRLLDQRGEFHSPAAAPAVFLLAISCLFWAADRALRLIPHFSPLVELHVQMND